MLIQKMTPIDTAKAYDQITHLWTADKFDCNNGIALHKKALGFVSDLNFALDVGCGCSGRFIDLLIEYQCTPEGIDISKEMIKLAKSTHPKIHFYQDDICQWVPPKQYTFITAWDSLWHIPIDQHQAVLTKLINALEPKGVMIFSCGGTDGPDEHSNKLMGPNLYYASIGANAYLQFILDLNCDCRHMEYDQYPEKHLVFIVQKK